jgi:hypothetical protein
MLSSELENNDSERETVNQKILTVLAITATILGLINLSLFLIPYLPLGSPSSQSIIPNNSQKIQLKTANTAIKNITDSYAVRVYVYLPEEIETLFNCYVQADYLTENNVWKTAIENIGIVNYDDSLEIQFYIDRDFKSNSTYIGGGIYFYGIDDPNLKIVAYGYLKP